MRSIQRIRYCVTAATLIAAPLVAGCTSTVTSEPMPSPSALKVEHREDHMPVLAAVDGDGRVFSTYWHGTDDQGYRMIIKLENPATGEHGQLRVAAIEETGVTQMSALGDFGEWTWSDEGLPGGSKPPDDQMAAYQPWLDFWTTTAKDPDHAQYLMPPSQGDIAAQDAMCVGVCNTIKGASCLFKNPAGLLLCNLVGLYVCDAFCNYTPSELACFVTEDGGCVQETCCQEFYGCSTNPISGCPF
jgi:hypothetical protein